MSADRKGLSEDAISEAAAPVLGDILKRARLRRELTLRDVEGRTGIPNAHISQIENGGIKRPDIAIVFELSSLYELDFSSLSEWVGYAGTPREVSTRSLEELVRTFSELDSADQAKALAFVQNLVRQDS